MKGLQLASFCVCCAFAACDSAGDPTAAAKAILEKTVSEQSQGYLQIANFVKTDAVSENRNGVDYYRLAFDMEVEGTKDGTAADTLPALPGFMEERDAVSGLLGHFLNICNRHGKDGAVMSFEVRDRSSERDCFVFNVEKGHRYKVDNAGLKQMTLAKHESGWVVEQWGR